MRKVSGSSGEMLVIMLNYMHVFAINATMVLCLGAHVLKVFAIGCPSTHGGKGIASCGILLTVTCFWTFSLSVVVVSCHLSIRSMNNLGIGDRMPNNGWPVAHHCTTNFYCLLAGYNVGT